MRFSPFNPVQFSEYSGAQGIGEGRSVRIFAESDHLMVQIYHKADEEPVTLELIDGDGLLIAELATKEYPVNEIEYMTLWESFSLGEGSYFLRAGGLVSNCIMVLPDADLTETALIQYAFHDNRMRDDVHNKVFGGIRYFDLRLPGGFKDERWMFKVDNEQFMSPIADPVELSAIDYTEKVLTIGSSAGVDAPTAELVNRIFTCPLVFVDGTRYTRVSSSAPERIGDKDSKMYVYTITLREAHYLDADMEHAIRLNLRRTPSAIRRVGDKLRRLV